ncbi:glycosyltransferase [uncultured Desulfovibrio sp.]
MTLNQKAFSEVNFRCFEAMACGAALLMEQCGNGLDELFTPDEDISPIP